MELLSLTLSSIVVSSFSKIFFYYLLIINKYFDIKVLKTKLSKNFVPVLGTPFYIFQISAFKKGKYHAVFTGMDKSPLDAVNKAFSEFCEGYLVRKKLNLGIEHRSGIACHITKLNSEKKAKQELFERDSFIMHFLHPQLKTKIVNKVEDPYRIVTTVELQTINTQYSVFLSTIYSKNTKLYYIGLGSCDSKKLNNLAISQSLYEATMVYINWNHLKMKSNPEGSENFYSKLESHLINTRSNSTKNSLNIILNGGSDELIKKNSLLFEFKIIEQEKRFNRIVTIGAIPNLLPLEFGEKWLNNKDQYNELMNKRGLTVTNWTLHPLL